MSDAGVETLIRINTLSPVVFTKYLARLMMAGQGGRIVNISSIVASTGYSGLSVYSATKASLVGFTRSLARSQRRGEEHYLYHHHRGCRQHRVR